MKLVKSSKIRGCVSIPASKSVAQRAILVAALAEGRGISTLRGVSLCDDCSAALKIAEGLGAGVRWEGAAWNSPLLIHSHLKPRADRFFCGESGLSFRMSSALAALFENETVLEAQGSLLKRPASMIEAPLRALGVTVTTNGGFPPVKIKGPMQGGEIEVDGSQTSQFLSGLLTALPLCPKDSKLHVTGLESRPYVSLTLNVLRAFGVEVLAENDFSLFAIKGNGRYVARDYAVEGDWSSASALLVAGAISGEVRVENLNPLSAQADRVVENVLQEAGARIKRGDGYIEVSTGVLKAFKFNASQSPDLVPALSVLATACSGRSVISGVKRLVHKESNRVATLISELSKIGARIREVDSDTIEIEGSTLKGGEVLSHGDHRIAMACAVAGLRSTNGVSIEGAGSVAKSYPAFFDDLTSLMTEN